MAMKLCLVFLYLIVQVSSLRMLDVSELNWNESQRIEYQAALKMVGEAIVSAFHMHQLKFNHSFSEVHGYAALPMATVRGKHGGLICFAIFLMVVCFLSLLYVRKVRTATKDK